MFISKEQQEIISQILQHEKDIIWLSKFEYAKKYIVELETKIENMKLELNKDGVKLE